LLNDDIRDSLANSGEEGAWFIAHWESIYLIYGGVLLSPLLIKGILTHSPSLIHSAEAAGNTTLKNEILSIYLAAVMQIKITNFVPRSLKVLDTPKVAWLSINEGYLGYTSLSVYSAHIDKLYRAHCYLLEGLLDGGKANQKGYALLYQGEVLASSTRDEVRVVIERLSKYGVDTKKMLEEIAAIKSLLKPLKNIDELVNLLGKINEYVRAQELEQAGVKVLFRGTTRDINGLLHTGNTNAIQHGISTSTDPLRAIVFAVESASKGGRKGVIQIALPKDLTGVFLQVPNRRVHFELEVVLQISTNNFVKIAVKEIPVEQARQLANRFFNLSGESEIPISITDREYARELIETFLPKLTPDQAYQFYIELIKL
jgi:hypothetical protein